MSVAAPEQGLAIPAGDPPALWAAAGRLSAAAAVMDQVAANLTAAAAAAGGGRRWVGSASDAFGRQVQETRAALGTGSGAVQAAATALGRLAGELQAAQEQARRAQAAAATAGGVIGSASQGLAILDSSGVPDPLARSRLQRTLEDARAELAGAQAAMAEAAERARVAGRAAAAALQAATQPATMPGPLGRTGDPAAVAAWWAGLTPVQRLWLLASDPALLGGLAGIPPAERDRANRRRLADQRARLERERAAVAAQLARLRADSSWLDRLTPGWNQQEEALLARLATLDRQRAQAKGLQDALAQAADPRNRLSRGDVYLLSYDPQGDGKAVIALGDPTRAAAIGVVVPGTGTTLSSINNPLTDAVSLRGTSDRLAGPAVTDRTSVVVWLGYDTPDDIPRARFDDKAQAGAPELVRFVDDLRASHTGSQPPRVTVLAHSYGTLVTALAARQGLAADAITLVGSPGVGAAHVTELGLPAEHVWAGRTPDDQVRRVFLFGHPATRGATFAFNLSSPVDVSSGYFHGPDPSLPDFGAQPIPLGPDQHDHSEYYKLNTTGITALTRILLGGDELLQWTRPAVS